MSGTGCESKAVDVDSRQKHGQQTRAGGTTITGDKVKIDTLVYRRVGKAGKERRPPYTSHQIQVLIREHQDFLCGVILQQNRLQNSYTHIPMPGPVPGHEGADTERRHYYMFASLVIEREAARQESNNVPILRLEGQCQALGQCKGG